ncbi:Imm57 family immunity protein [Pseudomonas schmalbachii]|uniref:Lysozyme inhibitor LprI N-terminal domain-containing protein n=1 Tax=Pseudomonas schmalbachii TaxID=2816993 RepID=A0ABS3TRP4_9PSED|nr:Imm57 family immunity protein [Pseudomonas schmalbachii]MBO3276335.1 hypothetical protein [Pseudomonas schmalbachii]
MKIKSLFGIYLLIGICLSSEAAKSTTSTVEAQQAYFVTQVIMIEFVHSLSLRVRQEREKCLFGCRGGQSALEISIDSLGVNRSDAATSALIDLLSLHLDAGGAEDRDCQLLARGKTIIQDLKKMDVENSIIRCRDSFTELRKRELLYVSDVSVNKVCHSENEIRTSRDELLQAIEEGMMCEQ